MEPIAEILYSTALRKIAGHGALGFHWDRCSAPRSRNWDHWMHSHEMPGNGHHLFYRAMHPHGGRSFAIGSMGYRLSSFWSTSAWCVVAEESRRLGMIRALVGMPSSDCRFGGNWLGARLARWRFVQAAGTSRHGAHINADEPGARSCPSGFDRGCGAFLRDSCTPLPLAPSRGNLRADRQELAVCLGDLAPPAIRKAVAEPGAECETLHPVGMHRSVEEGDNP